MSDCWHQITRVADDLRQRPPKLKYSIKKCQRVKIHSLICTLVATVVIFCGAVITSPKLVPANSQVISGGRLLAPNAKSPLPAASGPQRASSVSHSEVLQAASTNYESVKTTKGLQQASSASIARRGTRQASSKAVRNFWQQPSTQTPASSGKLMSKTTKLDLVSPKVKSRGGQLAVAQRASNWAPKMKKTLPSSAILPIESAIRQASSSVLSLRQQRPNQSRQERQVSSQAPATGGNKCALILQRTYVRKLTGNDIDESVGLDYNEQAAAIEPTGRMERVCIKFDDVNQAISEAKQRRQFQLTAELAEAIQSIEPAPPFIAQLGELNQETTKILAEKFDLSADEILNGLPLIDMSRTDFWPICPLMVKPIKCDATGRFRSFTGHCNNLKNPAWGAAQTPFVRYLAPKHPDGIEKDRVSVVDGSPLPSPRLVTSLVHRDHDSPSSDLSLLIMVWGQIIDHDVALAAPPRSKLLVIVRDPVVCSQRRM